MGSMRCASLARPVVGADVWNPCRILVHQYTVTHTKNKNWVGEHIECIVIEDRTICDVHPDGSTWLLLPLVATTADSCPHQNRKSCVRDAWSGCFDTSFSKTSSTIYMRSLTFLQSWLACTWTGGLTQPLNTCHTHLETPPQLHGAPGCVIHVFYKTLLLCTNL